MKKLIQVVRRYVYILISASLFFCTAMHSSLVYAGGIFLNGVDISSARNQNLKNVNVTISEDGTVFIEAPHYQVREDDIFTSLGKTSKGRFNGIDHGPDKMVGKKGNLHPNSQVDPSTLPTYKEFQNLSSKELRSRTKAELDEDSSDDSGKPRREQARDRRLKGSDLELQEDSSKIIPQETEALNSSIDSKSKTNKTTGKKSGNLLRRDEREEISR